MKNHDGGQVCPSHYEIAFASSSNGRSLLAGDDIIRGTPFVSSMRRATAEAAVRLWVDHYGFNPDLIAVRCTPRPDGAWDVVLARPVYHARELLGVTGG